MSTLKVACIGDSHFDEKNRLDDNVAVHRAFVEQAREAQVDVILHGGDFFERRSTPAERNALSEFLIHASSVAPVFGCKGNHDAEDDLDVFNFLDTANPMHLFQRPTEPRAPWDITLGDPSDPGAGFGVIALPWFSKASIVAALPADTPAGTTTEATIRAALGLLATLRLQAEAFVKRGLVPLLVAHVQVAGSETSTGQTLVGTTVELAPNDILEVGCAYASLGHIHKAQSWCDGRVAYSGSPQRHNFGESEAKGWNLVTIDTERWAEPGGVTVEFRELPARKMLLIDMDWTKWHEGQPPGTSRIDYLQERGLIKDALVRLRYKINAEDLHLVDDSVIAAAFKEEGAHDIQIETVVHHTDRVRCAEIVTAESVWDKLVAYWNAKSIVVGAVDRERIKAKLGGLQQ